MRKKITLDMLTVDTVSVKTELFLEYGGTIYPVGKPHRKEYWNSTSGRQEIITELPQAQQSAIFSVWGMEPTIKDKQ